MTYVPSEPVIMMTASDIELLWRGAGLDDLRRRHRSGDTALYALLVKMHQVRLLRVVNAADGIPERHSTASEEREWWTVEQLATAAHRAPRTVRKDIENNELQATKTGRVWVISDVDAKSYLDSRRRTL